MRTFITLLFGLAALGAMGLVVTGPYSLESSQPAASLVSPVPAMPETIATSAQCAPGCRHVETLRTPGNEERIFAWFDGHKAISDWFHGGMQARLSEGGLAGRDIDDMLASIPNGDGPLLAIVTVKPVCLPRHLVGRTPSIDVSVEYYEPTSARSFAAWKPACLAGSRAG